MKTANMTKGTPATVVPNTFKKSDQDDLDAIALMQKNPQAFSHFVHKYQDFLFIRINRAFKDEDYAKDILQDVFYKVFLNISKYEKEYTFNTWLSRLTENHIIDIKRKRKTSPEFNNILELDGTGSPYSERSGIELPDEDYNIFQLMENKNEKKNYEDACVKAQMLISKCKLSEQDQAIMRLFYLEKKRQVVIAQMLGITHGIIRVRLLRIKKRLKQEMINSNINTNHELILRCIVEGEPIVI